MGMIKIVIFIYLCQAHILYMKCPSDDRQHAYFDAAAQAVGHPHKAVDGEAGQVGIADALNVGGINLGDLRPGAGGQPALVQRGDDFGRKRRLHLFGFGVAKIGEDIAAAVQDFRIVGHIRQSLGGGP